MEVAIVLGLIFIGCYAFYIYKNHRANKKIQEIQLNKANEQLNKIKSQCQKLKSKIKKNIDNDYLNFSKSKNLVSKYFDDYKLIKYYKTQFYSEFGFVYDFFEKQESFRESHNKFYIEKCKREYSQFFIKIDDKKLGLTDKQLEAVFTDEDASLINAGAGTGKTKTIESKILHLVKNRDIPLEEILVMTYSKKSQLDMMNRIGNTLKKAHIKFNADKIKETISTFHAFGKNILEEENDVIRNNQSKRTKLIGKGGTNLSVLTDEGNQRSMIIKKAIDAITKSSVIQKIIAEYILYYNMPQVSVTDFESLGAYYEYTKRTYKTLLKNADDYNIIVKSYGEVLISNFLWQNDIEVQYEPIDHFYTNEQGKKKAYRPDFYLPKYDIYIEYFGIDKKGNTAPDVSSAEYKLRVTQKISAHTASGNKLIYILYADLQDGKSAFLNKLKHELIKHKVILSPKSDQDVISMKEIEGEIKGLTKVLNNFLSLYKESHTTLPVLRSKAIGGFDPLNLPRNLVFLDIFEAYLNEYTKILAKQNLMDFGDMIYRSIDAISSGQVKRQFKYILIDEFQDISQARAELIKSIIQANRDCRLFCVGDDWQSIYQFAGSDVNIFTNFGEYFGYTKEITLDKTFRFNQGISDISGDFIMMNAEQNKKELTSNDSEEAGKVLIVQKEEGDDTKYLDSIFAHITEDAGKKKNVSVLLLTRYNRHKYKYDTLLDTLNPLINSVGENEDGEALGLKYKIPWGDGFNIHLTILTSHKSKGLEADYVILDYVEQGTTFDFPSNFEDDPILQMILNDKHAGYRFAEERRVFYVSMTRGKQICFLCYLKGKESLFLKDLVKINKDQKKSIVKYLTNDVQTVSLFVNESLPECPTCNGKLKIVEEGGIKTIKCRHYPRCSFMQTHYLNSVISCPVCDKAMVLRKNGATGEKFWGCSNYHEGCMGNRKYVESINFAGH